MILETSTSRLADASIRVRYQCPFALSTISGDMGMVLDNSFFRRAATGLSPHQYVVQRRVEQARGMLADTDLTLAER